MSVRRSTAVASAFAFVACSETPTEPGARVVSPRCSDPAPLLGAYNIAAPGYIVSFKPGTNVAAEVATLSSRLHFAPRQVWEGLGFAMTTSPETVAALRCGMSIAYIERDNIVELR